MLPKIITTCAVRASTQGSHGGLFVVDLETEQFDKVFDWSEKIDLVGRGAERGLRGIAQYNDWIVIAASSALLFFNKSDYKHVKTVTNDNLKYCHEICRKGDILYVLSTGFDAIIRYDLKESKFIDSYKVQGGNVRKFNPNTEKLNLYDGFHFNSISVYKDEIYVSGTNHEKLWMLRDNGLMKFSMIPRGTHNAHRYKKDKMLANDTVGNRVVMLDNSGSIIKQASVKRIGKKGPLNEKIARQPFARGMAETDEWLIAGSSPAMISVYRMSDFKCMKNIVMNQDIRHTIHGIEVLDER